jgi:hypothetical protein
MGCRAVGEAVGLNLHTKNKVSLTSDIKIKLLYHKSAFYIISRPSISHCRFLYHIVGSYHIVGLYITSRAPTSQSRARYHISEADESVGRHLSGR